MTSPRVLFAGTPEFARVSLLALVNNGFEPVAVLTQPDRPAGRGKRLTESPVKKLAVDHGIPVLQPPTLREEPAENELRQLDPDILVVAAYGLILPQAVLDIPRHGCLNVHASLLPRWRGAAPIQAAIRNGDPETGISLMSMAAGLDCGPVYATRAIRIRAAETAGELHERLARLGAQLLVDELPAILAGKRSASDQDESQATYAPKITTADARLDWRLDAVALERHVRAFNPVPGAWCRLGDERIKCWRAHAASQTGEPGAVLAADADGIVVACGSSSLVMTELQRPGKKRVSAAELAAQLELGGKTLS